MHISILKLFLRSDFYILYMTFMINEYISNKIFFNLFKLKIIKNKFKNINIFVKI